MAGDPSKMENKEDRSDAEKKANDLLLVKYFSMHYRSGVRKLINATLIYCKLADYPLLLIYGMNDNIVDIYGCVFMYKNWIH